MRVNIGLSHETVDIRRRIGITDTQFYVIIDVFFGTESNTFAVGIKASGLAGIVSLGVVEQPLNPHGAAFENAVAGGHAFIAGYNRTAA